MKMNEAMGQPSWCHHHGNKMMVAAKGIDGDFVIIQGSAAELRIERSGAGWVARYRIRWGLGTGVHGTVYFTEDCLRRAFCGDDEPFDRGGATAKEHGATTGFQGVFIRTGRYLNIPGPGTGHDGDPNVSIHLDEGIAQAVWRLLRNSQTT